MIIYKITNILNGKAYVGQTIRTLEERWKDHQSSFSRCLAIKSAIEKYGVENFIVERIDSADNLEELNKKEGHWIESLNSLAPNGYNLKTGGNQPRLCQESIDKSNLTKKIRNVRPWNEGLTKDDPRVASYIRHGADTHAYGKVGYCKGKKWSEESKMKLSEVQTGRVLSEDTKNKMSESRKNSPFLTTLKKSILCTTNNTVYESMSDASRALNISVSNLCNVLKGKRKTAGGYEFVYVESEK